MSDMYLPEPDQQGRVYHAWMYDRGVIYARSLPEADALAETWGIGGIRCFTRGIPCEVV